VQTTRLRIKGNLSSNRKCNTKDKQRSGCKNTFFSHNPNKKSIFAPRNANTGQ
jgi:hypothetical protein